MSTLQTTLKHALPTFLLSYVLSLGNKHPPIPAPELSIFETLEDTVEICAFNRSTLAFPGLACESKVWPEQMGGVYLNVAFPKTTGMQHRHASSLINPL